ncbi:UL2 uracil DNA glycosylase (UDG) [Chelonid alphaherpesvirus 5]|uniref:UL2 uracil DNA glycosylase (UDG) n=1 Tax=Chelonid alphaherpesvirus 5 TaxID=702736 RepID=V5NWU7_9ALPH|nr:UL2 uracil DNA glycosylase (UDG) [Chelonid alphaherpesvirus 5]AHA93320.1 UL2 uracil DNA glycosylase (UDG) [Chelonid alphaherpesvirus 5]
MSRSDRLACADRGRRRRRSSDDEEESSRAKKPRPEESYLTLDDEEPENASDPFLISDSWREFLAPELRSEWFKRLTDTLRREARRQPLCPKLEDVFAWTRYCGPESVKVVILGQDPYHTPGCAHGLAFSVPFGRSVPPSLRAVYNELSLTIPGFSAPTHGHLTAWARRGVLLLNATLTVCAHRPGSHAALGWQRLTKAALARLQERVPNIVFMLWGKAAQNTFRPDEKRHLALRSCHPSPLAQSRESFVGNRHFLKANAFLEKHGRGSIDWRLPCGEFTDL